MIRYVTDPFPSDDVLRPLWRSAWDDEGPASWRPVFDRSLAHVAAYDGDTLVSFVNVAWDGGQHAFILDTSVHRDWQRQGIATRLVAEAAATARARGAAWLHVDYDQHHDGFYRGCGFQPTLAGLIRTRDGFLLVYAFLINNPKNQYAAKVWQDRVTAAISTCGCRR